MDLFAFFNRQRLCETLSSNIFQGSICVLDELISWSGIFTLGSVVFTRNSCPGAWGQALGEMEEAKKLAPPDSTAQLESFLQTYLRVSRNKLGKAKAHLELNLAKNAKENKKDFFKCINNKRKTKDDVGLLISEGEGLV